MNSLIKGMKGFLRNEYIYSIVMKFFSIGIGFLQSILLARYLGASLQGTSTYIASVIAIGCIVITFGMHQAYPLLRKRYGKEKVLNDFVSAVLVIFAIYVVISFIIAFSVLSSLEYRVAAILIPLFGYSRIMAYICLVESPNVRNSWWSVINVLDVVVVTILMFVTTRNLGYAIFLLALPEILKSIIYTILLHQRPHFHKGLFPMVKELFRFGFLPMLALLMTTLNYKIDVLMLRSFPFITKAQIGVYSIGMSMADRIMLIADTLKGVLVSKLAKGAEADEVAKVSRFCFWAGLCMCAAFLILGQPVINYLYGDEYRGAYSVLLICSFGALFIGYFKLIAQYNIVNGKQIRNVLLLSASILINCGLNLLLIPKYELNGAAFASGVGYFCSGIIFVVWFSRSHKIAIGKMFVPQKGDIKMIKSMFQKKKKVSE